MAGFAAAIGGAGQQLQQYGQQMRSILEQRREGLANLFTQRAQEETDPGMRSQWLQGAADTLAGKDFGKIFPTLIKAHDAHAANTAQLGQTAASVLGTPPPPPPAPPPGPGSGLPGGLGIQGIQPDQLPPPASAFGGLTMPENTPFSSLIGKPLAPQSAAQPADSPIAGNEGPIQATPSPAGTQVTGAPAPAAASVPAMSAIAGLPVPEDPGKIIQETLSNPLWEAPANRPLLQAGMNTRLAHQEALRQAIETQQATLAYKRAALNNLKNSPVWDKLPQITQAQYEAEAGGMAAPPMAAQLMEMNGPRERLLLL